MENRKKNGLIRLLGKIGRKVKILRVPLTVLVVVCVSIHHLFRQLFFDVKYHTVRMRALMGAVCVALLLTLFVIPAVADEMFLLTTEYEEITSEEEATPTPTPTPEIVEEVPSDDNTPTDVAEAPTTDEQTDDTAIADEGAQGEGTEAQGDGTTVKDDEGITYEVDENGNIIGGDDVKKLKKNGVAAKNVGTPAEIDKENAKIDITVTQENGDVNEGEHTITFTYGTGNKIKLDATLNQDAVPEANKLADGDIYFEFCYHEYEFNGDSLEMGKSAGSDVIPTSTSTYLNEREGYNLNAGIYEVYFIAKMKGTETSIKSTTWKIIVKKGTLTINNYNTAYTGFDGNEKKDGKNVFWLTDSKEKSDIPKSDIPTTYKVGADKLFTGVNGDIDYTIGYMVVNAGDSKKYWSTKGSYKPLIKVDATSRNYSATTIVLDDKLFVVDYHDKPSANPYSISPVNPTGNEADNEGNKWYKQDVKITPSNGYLMMMDGDANEYTSKSSKIYTQANSASGAVPGAMTFYYDKKYRIEEAYNIDKKFYVDTSKPYGGYEDKKGVKITSAPQKKDGYFKDDVYFDVTVKDDISGVDEDTIKCYAVVGNEKEEISLSELSPSDDGKTYTATGEIDTTKYSSGNIQLYVVMKDNAGNEAETEKTDVITIDKEAPVFFSTESKERQISSENEYYEYYIAKGKKKSIAVYDDVGLSNVKKGSESIEITSDDKKTAVVKLDPPESGNSPSEYTITATDFAGNESYVKIKVYLADIEIDDSEILFGNETVTPEGESESTTGSVYGYIGTDLVKNLSLTRKNHAAASLIAKVKDATIEGGDASDFIIEGSAPSYTIRPRNELDVGVHKDIVEIEYDLIQPGAKDVIAEHSVNIPISFTVVKKELTVTYLGNTEFFHAKADFKLKKGYDYDTTAPEPGSGERFAVNDDEKEIAVMVSGFVYEQEDNIKEKDTSYKDPTMPGIGERHDLADKATKRVKPNSDGAAAKNYYFTCKEGIMTCVRRQLPDAKEIVGTEGSNGWYTSKVTIKPSSKEGYNYTIMDYTSNVSDVSGGTVTYAEGKKDYDPGNGNVDEGFNAAGYTFHNETKASGVTKYYYIHNEDTDEVSSLMWDVIKIDRTAPHETYTAADKADTKDGTIGTKDEGDLPYISVDADKWSEFLHAVTLGLYFNANRKVTVHNAYDPDASGDKEGSSISDISYLIQDKSAADPAAVDAERTQRSGGYGDTETSEGSIESVIGSAEGWTSVGAPSGGEVSFNVTETDIDEGYLYVRITNGAGLKTYLTIGRLIIFDSKGPQVTADHRANYDGTLKLSTEEEFSDGATFIAEKVHFTISDSNLHAGSAEDPAVRVYKGTDISNASNIVGIIGEDGSSTGEQAVFINKKADGAEKAGTEWGVTLYCGNYMNPELKDGKATYTIVAKDDSGFVTIRYFTIVKPIYDISMASQVFTTEVYGYGSATSKTLSSGNGWSRTSKANADANVTDLSLDTRGANYFNVEKTGSSSEWKITPKTNLNAGTYTAVATLTYDDTDGETKKTNGNILFRVDKRELTATYLGDTIRVGEVPTTDGKLSVTGFITGEGVADSSDGTVHKASGYVSPVIKIPSNLTTTTIVTPSGGSADNYRFNYVGGVLTVVSRKAEKGTHYTVTGTLSDTGWYVSNITLAPKSGYVMTSDALGKVTMNNILITQDTSDGTSKFYIKDSKTGEIYEQNIFTYKKDTVAPVISGVVDGLSYKANKKEITVTDDNLLRVAVNGTSQVVSGGKSTFNIVAEQKQTLFFIVAEDRAGHMTTSTVTLMQEDGADADDIIDEDDYDDSDDDMIQDDTNGGDDSDLGTFTKKVQLVDGAPSTTFTSTNKELKSNVLSSGERTVMKEGSDVNVRLRVQNIDGSVSQADKELVIAALGDYTVAKYLDITLWKTVGSGAEKQVTSTSDTISVTISIPSSIRSTTKSGKVRQFAIVRVHNGSATVLQDRDSSANTITINTSKFSVYALAYRDVDASRARVASSDSSGGGSSSGGNSSGGGSSGGSGGSGGSGVRAVETDGIVDGSPQTGDKAPIVPTAVGFGVALIGMITVIIIRRRMDYEWVYVDEDGNIIEEEDIR